MIHRHLSYVFSFIAALGLGLVASSASADTPAVYDWPHQKAPVMVHTEGGLVFLGKNLEPRRAYSWDPSEGDKHQSLFLPDLDENGSYEVVGGGDPTFALDADSNPAWSLEEGCDQVLVADFAANDKKDVMCAEGDAIDIYTHDRQKIWSAELGVPIDWCRAGDINGDLKADLECKLRGRESYTRVDVNGATMMAQESEEAKLSEGAIELEEASPVSAKVWKGEREFDLNGDGATEESIQADGRALVIQSRSKEKAVARVELDAEIRGAIVKNIDGKETPEIVAVTDESIAVMDAEGETLGTYPVDASDYDREPVAALASLYARGFENNEKAQQAVRDVQDELDACYADRVSGNLFVGIGEVIYKMKVGQKGEVTDLEMMHSAIRDDGVEGCAEEILEGLEYPKPKKKEEGDGFKEASLNITLKFTFNDTPR